MINKKYHDEMGRGWGGDEVRVDIISLIYMVDLNNDKSECIGTSFTDLIIEM